MLEAPKNKNLIITLASIGHALELYDYLLYGVMIPFLVPVFFPAENFALGLIFGYISFAISFLFAPIGAIFWGRFGDKFGRQKLLRFSLVFMAIPALAISLLPTYASIGILAPILLIMFRILQGISASGEVMGAKIFAMEHLGAKYYGAISGIISAAGGVGLLLAMVTGYIASKYTTYPDFWRYPFLFGFCIYFIGILIRKNLSETLPFLQNKKLHPYTTFRIFANLSRSILVFALGGMVGVMSYTLNTFINPYLSSHGMDKSEAYETSIIGIFATILGSLIAGKMFNHLKNNWRALILCVLAYALLQPFLFTAIHAMDKPLILSAIIVYGFLLGTFATYSSIAMYLSFPTHLKCRGILFNYSFGVGLCGGLTPLVLQLINAINQNYPMIAISTFSLIVALVCFRWQKYAGLNS